MSEEHDMPDEQRCRELGLPHKLLCKRGHILSSKLGVTEDEFDGTVSKILPRTKLGKRWRYYTSGVIQAFRGGTIN